MDNDLTPEQQAEAQRIYQTPKHAADADLMALARLLAAKADDQLLGATDFQVRDIVHQLGARPSKPPSRGEKKGYDFDLLNASVN